MHALLAGSPAIDAGSDDRANDAGLTWDQRGLERFFGTDVDIGAYEYQQDVAPVAADDGLSVNEDTTLSVLAGSGVLANDSDANGDTLSAVLVSGPTHGTLTLESDGSFNYTPDAHFIGADSFSYKANDGAADSNVATVTITVNPGSEAFVVSTLTDESDGDFSAGDLSLREALALVAARSGDDVVQFDNSLSGGTITLDQALGQLEIDSNVDVRGLGADQLTVDADGNSRVIYVSGGVVATLSGLTITGGSSQDEGGGVYVSGSTVTITDCTISGNTIASNANNLHGAGIYSDESELTITNSTVSGNSASGNSDSSSVSVYSQYLEGGGIYSRAGTLTITNSEISQNSLTAVAIHQAGAGIYNSGSEVTIANSTISGNISFLSDNPYFGGKGGGIFTATGTLAITSSTISGNSAGNDGGGIYICPNSVVGITNSTISGNTAAYSGGIFSQESELTITNSTISGNVSSAGDGDGINIYDTVATIHNTILDDEAHGNFHAASSHNLIRVIDGSSGLDGTGTLYGTAASPLDLMLGSLADNGGPTLTHALLSGSPALDAGSSALANDTGLTQDQRGSNRFIDANGDGTAVVDIGAYESAQLNHAPVAVDDTGYDVDEDTTLHVSAEDGLLSNDTDAEEDQLYAMLVPGSGPSHGTMTLNMDGSFTYRPGRNFAGTDSFRYRAWDGTEYSEEATVTITVNAVNDGPVIDDSDLDLSAETVDEGGSVRLTGSFSDPEGGAHTVTVDWGDGTQDTILLDDGVTSFETADRTYADDPAGDQDDYAITVTVTDQHGLGDSAGTSLTVENVDPTLAVGRDWIVVAGRVFSIEGVGVFSDPGCGTETFSVTIDWGDGTTDAFTPDFTDGGPGTATTGSFDGEHTYGQAGEYTVTLSMTDDDGGAAAKQFTVSAVSDLVGSFVTHRGGWLYVKSLGGSGEATTEFGLGTSVDTHGAVLTNLPQQGEETLVRHVRANEELHFSLKSQWQGQTAYAFSSQNDAASLEAFADQDDSLGWGGAILEQTARHTWVLHLDDPLVGGDGDGDVVIQIRIGSAPPSLGDNHNWKPPAGPSPAPVALPSEIASSPQASFNAPKSHNTPTTDAKGSSVSGGQNGMSAHSGSSGSGSSGRSSRGNSPQAQPTDAGAPRNTPQDRPSTSQSANGSSGSKDTGGKQAADGAAEQGSVDGASQSGNGAGGAASGNNGKQSSKRANSPQSNQSSDAAAAPRPTTASNDSEQADATPVPIPNEVIDEAILRQEPSGIVAEETLQTIGELITLALDDEHTDDYFESNSPEEAKFASLMGLSLGFGAVRPRPTQRSDEKKVHTPS